MRIALVNSFPNKPCTAEREFTLRTLLALRHLGWEGREAVTSDDINEYAPDCVLVMHEYTPKLTRFPTIGLLWSPVEFYRNDASRLKNILSWDGYVCGSPDVADYLDDFLFSTRKPAPVADFLFFPSCQDTPPPGVAARRPEDFALFYAGVHWDGQRHAKLLRRLSRRLPLKLHGPPGAWTHLRKNYQGQIPFDGVSILDAIRQAGVALCLHKQEHRNSNLPSMRLFEAAAAGAVIIADDLPIVRETFGDALFYVDPSLSPRDMARQIEEHFHHITAHPKHAQDMARQAHAVFHDQLCLERQLTRLSVFLDEVRSVGSFTRAAAIPIAGQNEASTVEYIMRIGSRSVTFIDRALRSLKNQTYPHIGVVLVQFADVPGLDGLLQTYRDSFASLKVVPSQVTGNRSTQLWDGMRNVTAPYFGNLDDDDELHPNHVAEVMKVLRATPDAAFGFSGTIQVQEEPGHDYQQPNFAGPDNKEIHENRHLIFLELAENYLTSENFVNSNSWIASREVLDEQVLRDPRLRVAEDVYFYRLLFFSKTRFVTSLRPTAVWNWRSASQDNSMMQEDRDIWLQCGERIYTRLAHLPIPAYALSVDDLRVLARLRYLQWRVWPWFRPAWRFALGCWRKLRNRPPRPFRKTRPARPAALPGKPLAA